MPACRLSGRVKSLSWKKVKVKEMSRTIYYILAIIFFLILNEPFVNAGTLTIQSQMSIQVFRSHIRVKVKISNHGKEPAYKTGVRLRVFDETWTSNFVNTLSINATEGFEFTPFISKSQKGRYPITAEVIFHDANRYPFSHISCTTFCVKQDTKSMIKGTANDISMTRTGNLILNVTNPEDKPKKVRVTLMIPRAFAADNRRIEFQLEKGEKSLVFPINNYKALHGTQHNYFLLIEYEQNGMHYSCFAKGRININDLKNWFSKTRWYWLAGLGLWIFIWCLYCLIGKLKSRPHRVSS